MAIMTILYCCFKNIYTASAVNKIYHLSIVNEWKANMNKEDYEYKKNLGVYIPYIKKN